MFTCPPCNVFLSKQSSAALGLTWVCPSCHGRALTLELLRHAVPQSLVNRLWQRARSGQYATPRRCPACRQPMAEVPIIPAESQTTYLDVCTHCHFVWFDTQEFEELPRIPVGPLADEAVSRGSKEGCPGVAKLEILRQDQSYATDMLAPPRALVAGHCHGMLGMPIMYNDTPLRNRPIVTWSLAAVIATVSFVAMAHIRSRRGELGVGSGRIRAVLRPDLPDIFPPARRFLHLFGNLYFLVVFGEHTEDVLGTVVPTFARGNRRHCRRYRPYSGIPSRHHPVCRRQRRNFRRSRLLLPAVSDGPCGYYVVVPLDSPAVVIMFALWVLGQAFEAFCVPADFSGVASFAHLGGAAMGALFWWWTRRTVSSGGLPARSLLRGCGRSTVRRGMGLSPGIANLRDLAFFPMSLRRAPFPGRRPR